MTIKPVQLQTKMVIDDQLTTKMVLCEQDYVCYIYIHTRYGIIIPGDDKDGEKGLVDDKTGDFDCFSVDKAAHPDPISSKE